MAETNTNANLQSGGTNVQGYFFLYILIAVFILAAVIFLFQSSVFDKRTIDARILKDEFYLNEDLVFTDNTKNASKWLWEFGNGARLNTQNGKYNYPKSGSYIVRLTVDGNLREQFPVTVKDTAVTLRDTAVNINGPTAGIVNEQVRLEAEGNGKQFNWSFGETNRIDVKGRTALYTYRTPGEYLVRLNSDGSTQPIYHTISITDPNAELLSEVVVPGEAEHKVTDDIKVRLQKIANGDDFNSNYYYLVNKYLCNNEKVTVNVEQDTIKMSKDFYAYCMGLSFGGEITLDEAKVNVSPNSTCASLLNIKQHSAKTVKK
jgi:hypothetical protein